MADETNDLVVVREVSFDIPEDGDGRTLEARIVPYNTPTVVADKPENGGTGIPYTETWLPGAFERQTRAPHSVKVWLNFEHEPGLRGIVGHGVQLEERPDALYGTFRVHENADGDKVLQMVKDGLLTGISLEAQPKRSRRLGDLVERVRAHLDKVSLCRIGAYDDSVVLAVREAPDDPDVDSPSERKQQLVMTGGLIGPAIAPSYTPITEPEPDDEPEPTEPTPGRVNVSFAGATTNQGDLAVNVRAHLAKESPREPEPVLARTAEATEALKRVGYEPLGNRGVVDRPWDGAPSRFSDDEYEASCLIRRDGDVPSKLRCSLPVLEPNGDLNVNALPIAATRLKLSDVSVAEKGKAARTLLRYYRQAKQTAPPNVHALAAR